MRLADVLLSFSRLRPEVQASCCFVLAGILSAALVLAASASTAAIAPHR